MDVRPFLDAKFLVGVPRIDQEHRTLFQIIGAVHDACQSSDPSAARAVRSAVVELFDYTRTHFASEEALMKEAAYPALAAHAELHQSLLARVRDFEIRIEFDENFDPAELATFLYKWLANHILVEDRAFGDYYRGVEAASTPRGGLDPRRPGAG